MGAIYLNGEYVPKSGPVALSWYQRAAERGNVAAQLTVGSMYRRGLGDIQHDYEQALKWYHKAAAQDSGEAEFEIGAMYQEGLGVIKNPDTAAEWYRKAVQHGYSPAGVALRNLQR